MRSVLAVRTARIVTVGDDAQVQALDLATAVEVHTVHVARAMGPAEDTGRLTAGPSADFIVLDRNLFEIPVQEIHDTRVLHTRFAGHLVHDADLIRRSRGLTPSS